MKFIAIEKLGFNRLIQKAQQLGIKVRGRLDYAKTWVKAIRKELIRRALQINEHRPTAIAKAKSIGTGIKKASSVVVLNVVTRATSPRAKLFYKHLGTLIITILAIAWLVISSLWDLAGELVAPAVDRCLKPVEAVVPYDAPIAPPLLPLRKVRKVTGQDVRSLGDDVVSLFGMVQRYIQSWRFRQSAFTVVGSVGVAVLSNLIM